MKLIQRGLFALRLSPGQPAAYILLSMAVGLVVSLLSCPAQAQTHPSLKLDKTIVLTGVTGKFDHLAIDTTNNLLFITAGTNHSVEVIDLKTDKVRASPAWASRTVSRGMRISNSPELVVS